MLSCLILFGFTVFSTPSSGLTPSIQPQNGTVLYIRSCSSGYILSRILYRLPFFFLTCLFHDDDLLMTQCTVLTTEQCLIICNVQIKHDAYCQDISVMHCIHPATNGNYGNAISLELHFYIRIKQ